MTAQGDGDAWMVEIDKGGKKREGDTKVESLKDRTMRSNLRTDALVRDKNSIDLVATASIMNSAG